MRDRFVRLRQCHRNLRGCPWPENSRPNSILCHVIDEPSAALYGEASLNVIEKQSQIMDFVQSRFEEMIGKEKVNWEPLITIGKSADENHAHGGRKKCRHGHFRPPMGGRVSKRLILGSVTERLVRTLPCPLLTVRGGGDGT